MHTSGTDPVGRRPGNVHHVDGHQGIFHVLRQAAAKIDMDVAALQVDGIGRMRHAPEAALLHGKTGDADAGIGFHQTAGTPVDQGLGLLLAGQRRVQARQDVHVGGVQGYGGPPDQQSGIRALRVFPVIHAGPQTSLEQQAHLSRTPFAQRRQCGTKFFHQPLRQGRAFRQLAQAFRKLLQCLGKTAPRSLYAPVYLFQHARTGKQAHAARGRHDETVRDHIGVLPAQLAQAGSGLVGQMGLRCPARFCQRDDIRPLQQRHMRVDLTGHRGLQMVETLIQRLARGRVEPFKVLDALVHLRGHAGAQGPHPVQAERVVAAQGIFQ